jgi:hypothetical protein
LPSILTINKLSGEKVDASSRIKLYNLSKSEAYHTEHQDPHASDRAIINQSSAFAGLALCQACQANSTSVMRFFKKPSCLSA